MAPIACIHGILGPHVHSIDPFLRSTHLRGVSDCGSIGNSWSTMWFRPNRRTAIDPRPATWPWCVDAVCCRLLIFARHRQSIRTQAKHVARSMYVAECGHRRSSVRADAGMCRRVHPSFGYWCYCIRRLANDICSVGRPVAVLSLHRMEMYWIVLVAKRGERVPLSRTVSSTNAKRMHSTRSSYWKCEERTIRMKSSNICALFDDWLQIKSNRAIEWHGKSHIDIPTYYDLIRSIVRLKRVQSCGNSWTI